MAQVLKINITLAYQLTLNPYTMNRPLKKDIQHERTLDGYLLLTIRIAGYPLRSKYLGYTIKEAKSLFWNNLLTNPRSLNY